MRYGAKAGFSSAGFLIVANLGTTAAEMARTEPIFFSTYIAMTAVAAAIVLIPGAPLVPILFLTQAVNAVMLLPFLAIIVHLARDRALMGELRIGGVSACAAWATTALIAVAVVALGVFTVLPGH